METTRLARVFAATNGSDAGRHAAQFARGLAQGIGARLRLLSVETTGVPGYASDGVTPADHALPADASWSRGIPGIEIVREAESWGADLVVIGRRDRSNGAAEPLGRTVETVVRRRSGPCLLIPPCVDKLGRMLVALDGTDRGLGILPFAETLATALDLPASSVYAASDHLNPSHAKSKLRVALLDHPGLGGADQLEIRLGSPVPEILSAVRARSADVLVVGVRRGGPLGEAGSGHVGRDLLLKAPGAILTVPI